MENTFTHHKYDYQDQSHKNTNPQLRTNKLEKKKVGTDKQATHKNTWHFINIFSKIKKFNRVKPSEIDSIEEEIKVGNSKKTRKCKFNEMDDKLIPTTTNLNETIEDDSNSIESKRSFFGKMNLESLLKIFADLHKKKQSSQNRQNTQQIMDEGQSAKLNYLPLETNPSRLEEDGTSFIIQKSNLPSNTLILRDSYDSPLIHKERIHNPVNSPSLINASFDRNNLQNVTATSDAISSTDSTLSLLNNVSIKLKNYLSEVKNNENDTNKENLTNVLIGNSELKTKNSLIGIQNSTLPKEQECSRSVKLNQFIETDDYLECKENQTILSDDADDKKLAYTIAETDIKRMIKELLKESKDLKNSIMATGIQEEPSSSFTKISRSFDSFLICRSLCNELVNVACNKHICSLKARKHLNVSFKRDTEQEVEYIITGLLENVLSRKPITQKLCINFCLVQTDASSKTKNHDLDPNAQKFRESNVYILAKKLYKAETRVKRPISPPKVTVRNLSASKRIKFVTAENSLTCRIRRSAALLMALYDEMRDYSYYSCTSNILCDLYESMIKQGLISMTNLKQPLPVDDTTLQESTQPDQAASDNSHSPTLISSPTPTIASSSNPSTSFSNRSDASDLTICISNDSLSSESSEDINSKMILPNLKYTYQSDEEINTPEEVKVIDDNATKNGNCRDVNMEDVPISEGSISVEYESVSINEGEAFIKR